MQPMEMSDFPRSTREETFAAPGRWVRKNARLVKILIGSLLLLLTALLMISLVARPTKSDLVQHIQDITDTDDDVFQYHFEENLPTYLPVFQFEFTRHGARSGYYGGWDMLKGFKVGEF